MMWTGTEYANLSENISELIYCRKSVRTFQKRPVDDKDRERLLSFAANIQTPYDLPVEYRILDAEAYGLSSPVILGAQIYAAGKIRRAPHAEEAFGYSFEQLLLYAASFGLGTVWIAGTMDRKAFETAMELKEDEILPCVSPLGYPAEKRSVRETMMRKGIRADSRLPFAQLFFQKDFTLPLAAADADRLHEPLELVRRAPSAVNKQPWRVVVDGDNVHFYEKKSKGFESDTGWDLQKVDMGIALCHFAAGLDVTGQSADFVIDDPGICHPADLAYIATYRLKKA